MSASLPHELQGCCAWPLQRTRVSLVPEIELWLLAPGVDVERACADLAELDPPPFWAMCWAGGQVLARYLIDHPAEVRGRCVVDLGAGCGVVAIAAARAGARRVVAVDVDPTALCAARANARLNGVAIEVGCGVPDDAEVVLAADVFYEPSARERVRRHARAGRRVLVGDPERTPDQRVAGSRLARFPARTVPDVDAPVVAASVYALD